ncbi:MAG: pyrimidine dimer DNA glycosylase/endonuclease V, partial [Limisphaerales bacterium]
ALWREGLLAKKALEGRTVGYKNHPQLKRFKSATDPLKAINVYLTYVFIEAAGRGYSFDKKKIEMIEETEIIAVADGQIRYEFEHLKKKLSRRDVKKYNEIQSCGLSTIEVNPVFRVVRGGVEEWEKLPEQD